MHPSVSNVTVKAFIKIGNSTTGFFFFFVVFVCFCLSVIIKSAEPFHGYVHKKKKKFRRCALATP